MCCFEHPYSGIFEERNNRKVAYIGVACLEIIARSFFAGFAAIEFIPAVKEHLQVELLPFLPLVLIYGFSTILHCLIFRGPQMLLPQVLLMTIAHMALVLSLVSILSYSKSENWDPSGLMTFSFATVAIIKFIGITATCCDLVDMTTDWGYLAEFFFGIPCVAAGIACTFFLTESLIPTTAAAGSLCGTILSMLSLLDLHQNTSINAWWWEERMIRGCIYHVIRQYSFTCCLRAEQPPDVLIVMENHGESRRANNEGTNQEQML